VKVRRVERESDRPRLAITLGDPRGIGTEVVEKALRDPATAACADFLLIGPEGSIAAGELLGVGRWHPGDDAPAAGRLAGEAVRRAVELALAHEVDGIVTAPLEKSAFHAAGWPFPGHTEMLKELTGSPDVVMMMASERSFNGMPLRVVLASTHVALRRVPEVVTSQLLITQSALTYRALRKSWDIPAPALALCAFNPHASDGGLFGDEEARVFEPAIRRLHEMGVPVVGPIPADTVFVRALRGEFDAVIAPYHDVGMAAFKTAAFGTGVNVTLGLPFPRTSPDHGTAIDIAGLGIADPGSMIEAIQLAARLASRFDTSSFRS
jgi:4-hydroxythreonine-4-phosphate dehydrogenase